MDKFHVHYAVLLKPACTGIGGSYSSVTSSGSIRCEVGVIRYLCDEN